MGIGVALGPGMIFLLSSTSLLSLHYLDFHHDEISGCNWLAHFIIQTPPFCRRPSWRNSKPPSGRQNCPQLVASLAPLLKARLHKSTIKHRKSIMSKFPTQSEDQISWWLDSVSVKMHWRGRRHSIEGISSTSPADRQTLHQPQLGKIGSLTGGKLEATSSNVFNVRNLGKVYAILRGGKWGQFEIMRGACCPQTLEPLQQRCAA